MKRNIFWMIWGIVSLVCVMIAGVKSFALEIEEKKNDTRPRYLSSVTYTEETDKQP
ncbi:MAG: hypothetical protein PHV05_10835 [Candidatus Riflebacteria bacterium]|nr:hypothetical protein [Candidatus Riflebacteria bacterium]